MELTCPVVLTLAPIVVLVTLTCIVQLAPGATGPPPVSEITVSPCALPDEMVPPQVLLKAGVAATAIPAGNGSTTATPLSDTVFPSGLEIVNVNTDVAPAATLAGANPLAMDGEKKTAVISASVLLPLLPAGSPPPDTFTLLVTGDALAAAAATVTGNVIGGAALLAAMAVVRVQVTVWVGTAVAAAQVQPVPLAEPLVETYVSPAGNVSVTVTVAVVVACAPLLKTVMV